MKKSICLLLASALILSCSMFTASAVETTQEIGTEAFESKYVETLMALPIYVTNVTNSKNGCYF